MKFRGYRGFALPTILIVSVILMSVLVVASVSVAGVRSNMAAQYYNQIAKNASEAGIAYAKACINKNGGVAQWSDAKPLRPFTDCSGTEILNSSDPNYYVSVNGNAKATFSVDYPSIDSAGNYTLFKASGSVDLVRTSNGAVWRTYTQNATSSTAYVDDGLPLGTSLSGYWSTPPRGYLLEDGSAISRVIYADLFALIGTTFGSGDGSTTFNLPDSRGRAAANINSADAEFDTLGEKYGAKTHILTTAQIPGHQHSINAIHGLNDHLDSGPPPTQYNFLNATNPAYGFQTAYTQADGGSGGVHNNIQPSIVKTFAIKYLKPDSHNSELPVGTSIDGYWSVAPDGYLYENGTAVSRSTYSTLFNALGVVYGVGNGSTTFNIPDSRGRVAVNKSAEAEFDTLGERNGEKVVTITTATLPGHQHGIRAEYGTDHYTDTGPPGQYNQLSSYPNCCGFLSNYTQADGGSGGAHNNIQPSIVKMSVVKYTDAISSSPALPAGTSVSGYWSTLPDGYSFENGSTVSRTAYASLFQTLSTAYGVGNGSTTFGLPNSLGSIAVNLSSSDVEFDTLGKKYGSKIHTLTAAEIPGHQHGIRAEYGTTGYHSATNNLLSYDPPFYPPPSSYNQLTTNGAYGFQTAYTRADGGSGGAHNNIQPYIVKNFAIKLSGSSIASNGQNLLSDSATEKRGSNEFLKYADLASIFNKYGSRQYTISFDIKSDIQSTMQVYMQNGSGSRYTFSPTANVIVPVTSSYARRSVTVTPLLTSPAVTESYLSFYGTYTTGNIPSVKNVKVELGSRATDWTPAPGEVKALVVGGGGGGGAAGGGGGGGVIYLSTFTVNKSIPYSIKVGSGGLGGNGTTQGYSGGNSSFGNIVAYGGGGGGKGMTAGSAGGSGGGGGTNNNVGDVLAGGAGTSGQGKNGGTTTGLGCSPCGGGGGASVAGGNSTSSGGGPGGSGLAVSITGTSAYYGGGGGGGGYCLPGNIGGLGGGGNGTQWLTGGSGTAFTGGGGGGGQTGGVGGSGIVVISYPTGSIMATGGDITYNNGYTTHTFKANGTFTVQSIAS